MIISFLPSGGTVKTNRIIDGFIMIKQKIISKNTITKSR